MNTCQTCEHSVIRGGKRECHLEGPQLHNRGSLVAKWPIVSDDEWCAKHHAEEANHQGHSDSDPLFVNVTNLTGGL